MAEQLFGSWFRDKKTNEWKVKAPADCAKSEYVTMRTKDGKTEEKRVSRWSKPFEDKYNNNRLTVIGTFFDEDADETEEDPF